MRKTIYISYFRSKINIFNEKKGKCLKINFSDRNVGNLIGNQSDSSVSLSQLLETVIQRCFVSECRKLASMNSKRKNLKRTLRDLGRPRTHQSLGSGLKIKSKWVLHHWLCRNGGWLFPWNGGKSSFIHSIQVWLSINFWHLF